MPRLESTFPSFPLSRPWKNCIGTGRLGLALQASYQEALDRTQRAIGFRYIRGHGLFSDDLGIYRVDRLGDDGRSLPAGSPEPGTAREFYNFTYLDQVFDAFLAKGIKPFLELGFMPSAMAETGETVFYWKGRISPPRDYGAWERMITALLEHCLARWGRTEVLSWPVEVWNEPNLTQFWRGADMEAYFRLYEHSVRAVKAVDGAFQVGGPAICGGADHWLTAFMAFVREKSLPLDFISRHAYAGRPPSSRSPELLYQDLAPVQQMLDELAAVRRLMEEGGFGHLPLHITEFNTSYHPLCPVHDTVLNAAWLARILSESGDYAQTMSYWTFCDVFEEHDVPRALFHGGFGLLGIGGIEKPTWQLFCFFNSLGDRVVHRDPSNLCTQDARGNLSWLAWNHSCGQADDPARAGQTVRREVLDLPLELLPGSAGTWSVRVRTINESHGNPRQTWVQLGRPRWPDPGQMELLRLASQPELQVFQARPGEDGRLKLALDLEANQVSLVEICRLEDASPDYPGLDDSLIRCE